MPQFLYGKNKPLFVIQIYFQTIFNVTYFTFHSISPAGIGKQVHQKSKKKMPQINFNATEKILKHLIFFKC